MAAILPLVALVGLQVFHRLGLESTCGAPAASSSTGLQAQLSGH